MPEILELEIQGIQGIAGPPGSAIPIPSNTFLANLTNTTANPAPNTPAQVKAVLGYQTAAEVLTAINSHVVPWTQIEAGTLPLARLPIQAVRTDLTYTNPDFLVSIPFTKVTGTATKSQQHAQTMYLDVANQTLPSLQLGSVGSAGSLTLHDGFSAKTLLASDGTIETDFDFDIDGTVGADLIETKTVNVRNLSGDLVASIVGASGNATLNGPLTINKTGSNGLTVNNTVGNALSVFNASAASVTDNAYLTIQTAGSDRWYVGQSVSALTGNFEIYGTGFGGSMLTLNRTTGAMTANAATFNGNVRSTAYSNSFGSSNNAGATVEVYGLSGVVTPFRTYVDGQRVFQIRDNGNVEIGNGVNVWGQLTAGAATFNGEVRQAPNLWHKDTNGSNRYYYASGDASVYQGFGSTPHVFKNGAGADIVVITSSANVQINSSGVQVSNPEGVSSTVRLGAAFNLPGLYGSTLNYISENDTHVFRRGGAGSADPIATFNASQATFAVPVGITNGSTGRLGLGPDDYIESDTNNLILRQRGVGSTYVDFGASTIFRRTSDFATMATITSSGAATFNSTVSADAFRHRNSSGEFPWMLYSPGVDVSWYIRDLVNSRMQVTFTPGATASAALTQIHSQLTVEGSARIGSNTATGLLYFGNGSNWIYHDTDSFYIDTNGGGVQFRAATTAIPYFSVTSAGNTTAWGSITSGSNISANRSLTLGADAAGGERITFQGVTSVYRTVIENNYDSNRAFAITSGGYDVIKCTADVYESLTIGATGTQNVVFPGVKATFNGDVRISGPDTNFLFGISGASYGCRFVSTTGSGFRIQAVDSTLSASFEPLYLKGSFVTVESALNVTGSVTSAVQELSGPPSTLDIPSGMHRVVKNLANGEVRDWVNDGGVMKSSPAYT